MKFNKFVENILAEFNKDLYNEGMKIKDMENQYLYIKPLNEGECPNCGQKDNLFFINEWDKVLCENCLETEALKYHYIIEK
jgi:DNA-directed RNA polymerase subunit M/transcription elongation factor TFIIS